MTDLRKPRVRPAGDGDVEAVFELAAMMAISFTVEPEAFRRSFAAVLATADAHLLVIDVDAQVGGYLLGFEHPAFFANGPVAWVEEIAVHASLRRQNLGSQLMTAFENGVRERGGKLVALATTRASSFYEAIGYDRHAAYFRKIL
jgi:GNAT superfamily N-acetyltransferase